MATKAIRATKQNAKRETEVSEAQIAAHWKKEEVYYPPKKFIQQANLGTGGSSPRFGRTEDRGPRDHPHADDCGAAHHHAGLRAARRRPLRRLRRFQRRSLRPPCGGLRQPRADLLGQLLSQRQTHRP